MAPMVLRSRSMYTVDPLVLIQRYTPLKLTYRSVGSMVTRRRQAVVLAALAEAFPR